MSVRYHPAIEFSPLLDQSGDGNRQHVLAMRHEDLHFSGHAGPQLLVLPLDLDDGGVLLDVGGEEAGGLRLAGHRHDLAGHLPAEHADRRSHARPQVLDLRLVHGRLDLHAGNVGQAEDVLLLANRGALLDLDLTAAAGTVPRHVVRVHHHARFRCADHALHLLRLQAPEPRLFQIEGRLFGFHLGLSRVALAIQVFQLLGAGEFGDHRLGRQRGVKLQLGALDGELLGVALQERGVTLAKHPLGVLQRVLRRAQPLSSDGDVGLQILKLLLVRPFEVFADGDLRHVEILFRLHVRSTGFFHRDLLLTDVFVELGGVEPRQHGPFLDLDAVLDQRQDRGPAGDLAFDLQVLGAFDGAVLGDGHHQVSSLDAVRQHLAIAIALNAPRQHGKAGSPKPDHHREHGAPHQPRPPATSRRSRVDVTSIDGGKGLKQIHVGRCLQ